MNKHRSLPSVAFHEYGLDPFQAGGKKKNPQDVSSSARQMGNQARSYHGRHRGHVLGIWFFLLGFLNVLIYCIFA